MTDNFFENLKAFSEKKKMSKKDYINYIKACAYIEIFEYHSDYSYTAIKNLDREQIQEIANYFTNLGFKCEFSQDNDFMLDNSIYYRFYLYWK